ncbi:bifunctional 4-hydroxy-2-oxoglutarate aldolase/2-dehydro-3-deoxy-phosphogluconate aldolase [Leifsonia sp. AG29]|uniref:bifunctional 4-hydroxy-2-oxoglutarate aldolase/2-dehydro-3-deoxy-phosphogluconate aldolase n=1 Tax=Leifsonia sp. AG29 TaxID=2598860 RepID=UPI00131CE5E9|nr:2-dehydro-3-deoxyphosphogluconate aldolase [Leifsonia sp. AG29]
MSRTTSAQAALEAIRRSRVIGIVRARSSAEALDDARALRGAGVSAIEISLVTPDAVDVIARLAEEGFCIGVGTALRTEEVDAAARAGAAFVVSPNLDERVVAATLGHGLASLPGVGTVSEATRARELGADLVKLFPAVTFGPEGVKAILASLPDLQLAPTGGLSVSDVPCYLEAGAAAVGMGSGLVRAARENPEAVRRLVTN